jgi:UDP-2,4-diacetamido-2,4,6-trideoxy-beta-L-altropyranose hydrolase
VQLWHLANDRVVRMNSFHPEPIPLDHHMAWYKNKLSSSDSRIWILEADGAMAAQIRYDRTDTDIAEIGFAVVAAFRGKGLGTKILELTWPSACAELRVKRVRGVVLDTNMPSVHVFLKAGFKQTGKGYIFGHACYIFERDDSCS